ncbi:tyrosine-protein phosphatase non-receptor type 11-like [Dysidea avara]|uniref:tyrosine-protein phosphatase non-receptor type 11-like n=1 Tax=Dysidea avara TaxID=196820 RepID=UPI003319D26C
MDQPSNWHPLSDSPLPLFATKVLPYHMREQVNDMSCVASKGSPTGFAEEFDHLHSYQCKVLHSRKEGTKPANQSKNRYPNSIPFDYNRIVLKTFHRSSSDYINAIVDKSQVRRKSTSPYRDACNDFWNILHEEDISFIIMATNESEHDNFYSPYDHE